MEGVGSGGRERVVVWLILMSSTSWCQNFKGGRGAEKIQVLRHFQHFPASACASKRVLLQGFELTQSENLEDFEEDFFNFGRFSLITEGFPRNREGFRDFRKDFSLPASLEPIDFIDIP